MPTAQPQVTTRGEAPPDSHPTTGNRAQASELVHVLSGLVLALYASAPHGDALRRSTGEPLTSRQMEAVILLSHRETATMGELADELGIGAAATSELVGRLCEKGVVSRQRKAADARVVHLTLAEPAERHARNLVEQWGTHVEAAFSRYPELDPATVIAFLHTLVAELRGQERT